MIGNQWRNRPFPSSLVSLFQSESKCETILMKMTLIYMKMKLHAELIFIWKVSHLDSVSNRGTRELGNGLFKTYWTQLWENLSSKISCTCLFKELFTREMASSKPVLFTRRLFSMLLFPFFNSETSVFHLDA